ncbi:MAG: UDP-N-acetylmuramoyl-L-alanyl-D-glutamate--2,6-diaminopimelate ligase [Flavobacteriales bacterium]|nr:UDP-N-acetylmuramoyl-L-alanyl-D-glutamate--2,6-diaminopimelate ligase [Flavobacteriales bacterium]
MNRILSDILYKAGLVDVTGSTDIEISSICIDSRKVEKDSLFIAIPGTLTDGHDFIEKAISLGARAVICERAPDEVHDGVTYIRCESSALAAGVCASNFYDQPSGKLKLVGITGTNGKTTTATLLFNLLRELGYSCGLLSTVVNRIDDEEIQATHTTPDPVSLNELLFRMVEHGVEYCFMEVSSHAIDQKRVAGITFEGAVFTNITHDHLDYHQTFDAYIKAKKALFDGLPARAFAIINGDDKRHQVMVQNCKARIKTFALKNMADYKAKVLENQFSGLHLHINNLDLYSKLVGGFNAYNLLAVWAVTQELELDPLEVLTALSVQDSVAGRFQYMRSNSQITAIIDYAHTPDALKNVLATIKDIRTGNEQVITVVGCGGNRDKEKRPVMARIAAELSDKVILTSDNPRNEDPEVILSEMKGGLDPTQVARSITLSDRKEAIKIACSLANAGDIILVAGKGHETYQEIQGIKHPFDDLAVVGETFKMLNK